MSDVSMHGRLIPEGSRVLLLFGSANRDPSVFPDPDKFDLSRSNARRAVTFSRGVHACLGIHLARLQLDIGISELLRRARSIEIDLSSAELVHSLNITGYKSLPGRLRLA